MLVYALGNPVTPYLVPSGFPTPSASTFAMMTLSLACANASASCSYTGARFYNFSLGQQYLWEGKGNQNNHLAVATIKSFG